MASCVDKIIEGEKVINDDLINNIMKMERKRDYFLLTYEGFEFFYKFYEHFLMKRNINVFVI